MFLLVRGKEAEGGEREEGESSLVPRLISSYYCTIAWEREEGGGIWEGEGEHAIGSVEGGGREKGLAQ